MRFLHFHNIIHKDLKPSNILVKEVNDINNTRSVLKIADFGISGIMGNVQELNEEKFSGTANNNNTAFQGVSNTGFTKGYASPEQINPIFRINNKIGKESDIFSFGIIILELVSSRLFFENKKEVEDFFNALDLLKDKNQISILDENLQKKIDLFLDEHRKDTPIKLKDLIKKCLRIDPQDRYQSFDDIVTDIRDLSGIDLQDKRDYEPSVAPLLFYSLRGESLQTLGNELEAKTTWKRSLDFQCNTFIDYLEKGIILSALRQYKEAIVSYDKALEINPQYALAYYNKGAALSALRQYKEAIVSYDKALEINP
jgi:serine/threonine protein kinase